MRSDRPWGRNRPWGAGAISRRQRHPFSHRQVGQQPEPFRGRPESLTMALLNPANKSSPETERRLSESRSCAGCATSLQGRRQQAKYCSDRCRVRFARRARLGALTALRSRLDSSIAESICIRADLDHLIGVDEMSRHSGRGRSASVSPGHQGRARVGAEPE
jgi:hypothetical protein